GFVEEWRPTLAQEAFEREKKMLRNSPQAASRAGLGGIDPPPGLGGRQRSPPAPPVNINVHDFFGGHRAVASGHSAGGPPFQPPDGAPPLPRHLLAAQRAGPRALAPEEFRDPAILATGAAAFAAAHASPGLHGPGPQAGHHLGAPVLQPQSP
ncbi:unnamed protein product, partial [Polarella glacialis]